jgi:hypothetical protein
MDMMRPPKLDYSTEEVMSWEEEVVHLQETRVLFALTLVDLHVTDWEVCLEEEVDAMHSFLTLMSL